MTAWWVHKKQKNGPRNRSNNEPSDAADSDAHSTALAPFCIDNSVRTIARAADAHRLHCPPSYYEVIGYFDPPPSYNDVLRVVNRSDVVGTAAYDNQITIDEMPPPFTELEVYKQAVAVVDGSPAELSANQLTVNTVIVIPNNDSTRA